MEAATEPKRSLQPPEARGTRGNALQAKRVRNGRPRLGGSDGSSAMEAVEGGGGGQGKRGTSEWDTGAR